MRGVIGNVFVAVFLGFFTVAAAQLPPEVMVDRYLLRAERLMAGNDHEAALDMMDKIIALQREHDLTLPEAFHFKYAQAAFSAGLIPAALASVNRYLATAGREGKFYREALELLDEAEQIQTGSGAARPGDGSPAPARVEPQCAGQPEGAACWMALANQPECYVWDAFLQPDETVTWTAECAGSLAQGTGTLTWVWDRGKKTQETTGRLQAGRQHGDWVIRSKDGDVKEGTYVEGKRHGHWVHAYADGRVEEGTYVEDKQQGDWVVRSKDGDEEKGTYVNGKRRGRWVWRYKDGRAGEGIYVGGKLNGRWVTRSPERTLRESDGTERRETVSVVEEGPYVEGKRHGHWVFRKPAVTIRRPERTKRQEDGTQRRVDGTERSIGEYVSKEGSYVDGKEHGDWVEYYATGEVFGKVSYVHVDGKVHGDAVYYWSNGPVMKKGSYVEGKKHGHWVTYGSGTTVPVLHQGPYVEGKKHGHWVEYGGSGKGPYVEGKKHGHWVEHDEKGPYVDGKRHGHWVVYLGVMGGMAEGPYVEGKKHGHWVNPGWRGRYIWEGPYVEGNQHGDWVIYRRNDKKKRVRGGGSYWNGRQHGPWVEPNSKGKLRKYTYKNGRRFRR